jgi:hypothetical protein
LNGGLRSVLFDGYRVTDEDLPKFKNLVSVQWISGDENPKNEEANTHFTDSGFKKLLQRCPDLTTLLLGRVKCLTEQSTTNL